MKAESFLKAIILSNGLTFTKKALSLAVTRHAKGQNLCYNMPDAEEALQRPQELCLRNRDDGYETVVSCVAPNKYNETILLDANDDSFFISGSGFSYLNELVQIDTVAEPNYYSTILSNGGVAKEYVSACGYDELNILPWRGCAISRQCAFCGINKISALAEKLYRPTAFEISHSPTDWDRNESRYLSLLSEAILAARDDEIYADHLHTIMISGNLSDPLLDFEAEIYARIARRINPLLDGYSTEGLIAVMEPPPSDDRLISMHQSGIEIVVFNLEVGCEPWNRMYCPGKNTITEDYILKRLYAAVPIFGDGRVWTNFVLGLEPISGLLERCEELARRGIVSSANVFHHDSGSRLVDFPPPSADASIYFFKSLAEIYRRHGFKPFYCAKALRTSLSNEAYEGRL